MKFLSGVAVALFVVGQAWAGMISLSPSPKDLGDLQHSLAYIWEIDASVLSGVKDNTEVTLYIDALNNSEEPESDDILFIHLLDMKPATDKYGTTLTWNQFGSNAYS